MMNNSYGYSVLQDRDAIDYYARSEIKKVQGTNNPGSNPDSINLGTHDKVLKEIIGVDNRKDPQGLNLQNIANNRDGHSIRDKSLTALSEQISGLDMKIQKQDKSLTDLDTKIQKQDTSLTALDTEIKEQVEQVKSLKQTCEDRLLKKVYRGGFEISGGNADKNWESLNLQGVGDGSKNPAAAFPKDYDTLSKVYSMMGSAFPGDFDKKLIEFGEGKKAKQYFNASDWSVEAVEAVGKPVTTVTTKNNNNGTFFSWGNGLESIKSFTIKKQSGFSSDIAVKIAYTGQDLWEVDGIVKDTSVSFNKPAGKSQSGTSGERLIVQLLIRDFSWILADTKITVTDSKDVSTDIQGNSPDKVAVTPVPNKGVTTSEKYILPSEYNAKVSALREDALRLYNRNVLQFLAYAIDSDRALRSLPPIFYELQGKTKFTHAEKKNGNPAIEPNIGTVQNVLDAIKKP